MRLSFYNITKDQSNIIKGVAMMCLVLHNFIHFTNGIGENEMSLNPERIYTLMKAMKSSYVMVVNGLFTYFGFYFLELFIFFSGYGLAKQYSENSQISYLSYLLPRLIKIYALLLFGIVVYFFLFYGTFDLNWFKSMATSSILMTNNFSFDTIFKYVGPWWYFSLTIQLYFLFPLLYKFIDKYKEKGLIALMLLSYVVMYALDPVLAKFNFPLYGNFIGHIPEFALGIAVALFPKIKFDWKILIPTVILFSLSNFFDAFFPFSFLTATILLLYLFYPIINYAPAWIKKGLVFLGSISMFMFLINGPIRMYTLQVVAFRPPWQILLMSLVHLVIVVLVSYAMSLIYNKFVEPFTDKLILKIK